MPKDKTLVERLNDVLRQRAEEDARLRTEAEAALAKHLAGAATRVARSKKRIEDAILQAAANGQLCWEENHQFRTTGIGRLNIGLNKPQEMQDQIAAVKQIMDESRKSLRLTEDYAYYGDDDYDKPINPHWRYHLKVAWGAK